jgi:hypothetical protein
MVVPVEVVAGGAATVTVGSVVVVDVTGQDPGVTATSSDAAGVVERAA